MNAQEANNPTFTEGDAAIVLELREFHRDVVEHLAAQAFALGRLIAVFEEVSEKLDRVVGA